MRGLNIFSLCFYGIFAGSQKVLCVLVGIVFSQHIFQERDGFLAFKELAINFTHDELQVNITRGYQTVTVAIHEYFFSFAQTPVTENDALQKFQIQGVFFERLEGMFE